MNNPFIKKTVGTNQHEDKYSLNAKILIYTGIFFCLTWVGSLLLNYALLKSKYVLSCGVNNQTVAYMISKERCNELFENKMAAMELARQEIIEANQDLFQ
jgi:hypothetical protein